MNESESIQALRNDIEVLQKEAILSRSMIMAHLEVIALYAGMAGVPKEAVLAETGRCQLNAYAELLEYIERTDPEVAANLDMRERLEDVSTE